MMGLFRRVFRRGSAEPVVERRLRICDKGMLLGTGQAGETEWSTDPEDPAAVAFREEHPRLRVLDYCPYVPHEWDFHQRHILIEARETPAEQAGIPQTGTRGEHGG